jgi:signal transduction histidine kinase
LIDDDVYGTFCFYSTEARSEQFSAWEVTLVDLMSRWVSYELQRRRANIRLQEKNDQLERFASIVSHDLRNPLNVAQGRAKLAAEENHSEHLEYVLRAHDRMEALIEDLLQLALEGEQVDDTTPVNLAAIVESCWETIETRKASLRVNTERTVHADSGRLQQLFENLLGNAIEHGGEAVTVTLGALEGGFFIEDDGRGIPADERDDVLDAGYSTADRGTGFGLSIVEQVVDAHGWVLRVADGSEGGARFEITDVEFVDR